MRIIFTGGGTAGHVYPLLSIIEEIKKKMKEERLEILYIGSRGGIEEEILKSENISSFFIYAGKWRRYWKKWLPALFLNFWDLFKVLVGFFQAFFIVVRFRPEIIVAKGGYVTLGAVFASWFCRIPVITHESDIVMGISNKICAKIAKKICVSFPPENYPDLPQNKLVYTGNPIRSAFFRRDRRDSQGKKIPTILITGGSQGSQRINHLILAILSKLLEFSKVIHLTGSMGYKEAKKNKERLRKELRKRYLIYDFLEKMPEAMKEADLIISRAGANTLTEIAAMSKPSILIPLPEAASDHQTKNAQIFSQNRAAILFQENKLDEEKLKKTIKEIIKNKDLLKEMGERAREFSQPKAANKIVEEIVKLR